MTHTEIHTQSECYKIAYKKLVFKCNNQFREMAGLLKESNEYIKKMPDFSFSKPGSWLSPFRRGVSLFLYVQVILRIRYNRTRLALFDLIRERATALRREQKELRYNKQKLLKLLRTAETLQVSIRESIHELAPLEQCPAEIAQSVNALNLQINGLVESLAFSMDWLSKISGLATDQRPVTLLLRLRIQPVRQIAGKSDLDPQKLTNQLLTLERIAQVVINYKPNLQNRFSLGEVYYQYALKEVEETRTFLFSTQALAEHTLPKSPLQTSFLLTNLIGLALLIAGYCWASHAGLQTLCLLFLIFWGIETIRFIRLS